MRILILSPYPELIERAIVGNGDDLKKSNAPPSETDFTADFIISFGYRYILKPEILRTTLRPIINIHISYLPWNRGADPNFWSWFDSTPKGVSIHQIDEGIDSGALLCQAEAVFESEYETLASSYEKLRVEAIGLFTEAWPLIRTDRIVAKPQHGAGSYHRSKDKEFFWPLLPDGFNSPVKFIEKIGAEHAAAKASDVIRAEVMAMKPETQEK